VSQKKETIFTQDLPVLQELTKTTEFTIHEKILNINPCGLPLGGW
jgi:hypothetical protein